MRKRTLVVDFSPVIYANLFSATSEAKRNGCEYIQESNHSKPKVVFNYEDILVFKIIEEISTLKTQFKADEVVLAIDNSKGGYWRKDYWSGYKSPRAKARDDSEIEWDKAFDVFDRLKIILSESSTFKVINVERVEGDDIGFVLSEQLSNLGQEVILHSLDHDWIYNLKHPGVTYFRTRKAQKKAGHYLTVEPGELVELELDHLIGGDPGDYIKNVKAYSVFSPEFKNLYPDKTPLQVWDKRHEIDMMFHDKYGVSAYKHPRYGYKMFLKSKFTVKELLAQNPIYSKNYELNKKIAMPEGIPQEIRAEIIEQYNTVSVDRNPKELQKYFMSLGLFELISKISFL